MIEDYRKNDAEGFSALYERKNSWSPSEFKKFAKEAEKNRLDWRPGPKRVSVTSYLLLADPTPILATGLLRFPLDAVAEMDGGNLEVHVPPAHRGKGLGSYCLSLMLFEAVRAGLRRALVTCPADDPAANRVIVKNRGQLFDTIESTHPKRRGVEVARYWIDFRG